MVIISFCFLKEASFSKQDTKFLLSGAHFAAHPNPTTYDQEHCSQMTQGKRLPMLPAARPAGQHYLSVIQMRGTWGGGGEGSA